MKSTLATLLLIFSTQAFAAPLEAVDCKKQMWAAALGTVIDSTSLTALGAGTFEIVDFNYASNPKFEYVVAVAYTSRVDKSVTSFIVNVKVLDVKTCKIMSSIGAG